MKEFGRKQTDMNVRKEEKKGQMKEFERKQTHMLKRVAKGH